MSVTSAEPLADLTHLADERWAAAHARDRKFWLWLAAAAVAHALVLIGFGTQDPRRLGDVSGAENAISVSLITQADLNSRSTVPETGGGAPGVARAPAAAQQQTAPAPEAARPPEPTPEPPPEAKAAPQDASRPSIAGDVPQDIPEDVWAIPEPGPEPAKQPPVEKIPAAKSPIEPQKKPPAKPQQNKTAKLDLTPPASSFNKPATGGGGAAGFERPPGITRSGANDDFARGVIRALQQTMPQLRNTFGRVTVRIFLNTNGDVETVQVVKSANSPELDQSVVFATKQTSYPLPPYNSNDADRTFLVTYVYR